MIDVHTGLGPYGIDTLLLHKETTLQWWHKVLAETSTKSSQYECHESSDGSVMKGAYANMKGGVTEGIPSLFPNAKDVYGVTQEFGKQLQSIF
jgi:hypothetical protein